MNVSIPSLGKSTPSPRPLSGRGRGRTLRACVAVFVLAGLTVGVPSAFAGDWTMFHHDIHHGGGTSETAVGASNASTLAQKWAFNAGSAIDSSPAIVKNTATGKTVAYFGTNAGTVDAVDTATGTLLWSYATGKRVDASPAVSGNDVFVGSWNESFYELNATTGAKICSFKTTGHIESSPVVVNGVAYFGDEGPTGADDGGSLWAINTKGCTLKWKYNAWGQPAGSEPKAGVWSPPAYATTATGANLVVVGSSSPEGAVYAFNASSGARVWRFRTQQFGSDEDVGAGPTISTPGALFPSGAVYVSGKDNMVYALNLATGAKLWQFSIRTDEPSLYSTGEPRSTAALVGNNLYLGWGEGLYDLNATTGAKIWNTQVVDGPTTEIISSPAVSGAAGDQVVISGDVGGNIYAWNATTGMTLKTITTGGSILGSTAISYGVVYVPSADDHLYAYAP